MFKTWLILFMMLISTAMFAQQGSTYVGAIVNYGLHKNYKNFGIGAKVQYEFIDNFRAEASGNYFFKKDYCTMWDVNLNAHYLIPVADKLTVYPLAGLTLLGYKVEVLNVSTSDSDFGFNVGAGIEYPITETIKLNFEAKYQYVKDYDRPVISAGIAFAL